MTTSVAVRLGEVAVFVRGITFKPEDVVPVGTPGSVACMRTKNVQKELDLSDVWGVSSALVTRHDQYLIPGDVLVSSANSWNLVGKCCWVPDLPWRSTFGGFVSVLRADPEKVHQRYLFHWFASNRTQTTVRSFGQQTTNISNLNVDRCLRLPLSLSPLSEQQRIVEILDKSEALRVKRRAALAQLDTLSQSIFLDMFGDPVTNPKAWSEVMVGDICEVKGGKRLPKGEEYSSTPTPFRYIQVTDLKSGCVDELALVYLKPEIQAEIARYVVNAGDVIISIAGSIGMVAPVPDSLDGVNLTENAAKLVPRTEGVYDPVFLAAFLQTPYAQVQIGSHVGQVTIGKLALFRIEKIRVPLPPIDSQRKFACYVAAIEEHKAVQQAGLGQFDALFASILQCAFREELSYAR